MEEISRKIRSGSAAIQRLKYNLPFKTLKNVYHTLIESVINYGIECWFTDNEYTNKIQKIQNRIIKAMLSNKFNKKYRETNENFKHANILTFENLLKFKIIKNNYLQQQQQNNDLEERYEIRNRQLKIPLTFNKYGERTRQYNIIKVFNELPVRIKAIKKVGLLKNETKKWLMNKTK